MSFASRYRGSELTIMVKLISIFGVVEACQMRELFSHLGDKQYSKIMSRLHQEGMLYTLPDAEHLASNRLSVNKVNWDDSVASFWTLISIKDSIQDFCAGEMPAILTVSTGEFDCDIIPVNDKALALINDACFVLPSNVRRLLVVRSFDAAAGIERRLRNDFVIVVGKDGVTGSYEL